MTKTSMPRKRRLGRKGNRRGRPGAAGLDVGRHWIELLQAIGAKRRTNTKFLTMAGVTSMSVKCRGQVCVGIEVSSRPVDGIRIPFPTMTELKVPLRKEDKGVPD